MNYTNIDMQKYKISITEKIIEFLLKNGYNEEKDNSEKQNEYRTFLKDGVSAVDINADKIVLVGDIGDWLHLPLNLYALIGALIHHRELAMNYNY